MNSITTITVEQYLQDQRMKLEDQLLDWVTKLEAPALLVESIHYSLLNGGKRIRPILLLATVNALNGKEKDALPFACALELIHTYSLIHDDLPSMDNDDYRRGKLTNHKVFGEGNAVLAGDALLTEAFGLMARAESIDAPIILQIIQEVVYYTGVQGMVGGQVCDIASEGKKLTKEELNVIHMHKTADLMILAVRTGAHLGKASIGVLDLFTQFAKCVGLAFQIQDDILDVIGDTQINSNQFKNTYPSIVGLRESQEEMFVLIEKAKRHLLKLESYGVECSFLFQITEYLLRRKH